MDDQIVRQVSDRFKKGDRLVGTMSMEVQEQIVYEKKISDIRKSTMFDKRKN